MAHLAFFTFAILREGPAHPDAQAFLARVEANFAAAELSVGFVARSVLDPITGEHSWGRCLAPRFFEEGRHQLAPRSLSLWASLEAVYAFTYAGIHAEALSHRREWYLPAAWPPYVAWWVPAEHRPDWAEAVARHEQLHDGGPSATAFDFKHAYGANGVPATIDRALVKEYQLRNAARLAGT
ncbi:MAG TPA: DUF3291 domain-containing protein [Gemmatimonadales bacterium]|nr:DUF3291 domain-containing protein [Gemmatimonadales bacterium]